MARGPFAIGDRVAVRAFDSEGAVIAVGETATIRVYTDGNDQGELRDVTAYSVRLDNGREESVTDRDDHLVPL